jgi:hypothetical protein
MERVQVNLADFYNKDCSSGITRDLMLSLIFLEDQKGRGLGAEFMLK